MTEQEEFFSPNHKRLLNIVTWAKYLAWVVLVVYILNAALQLLQHQYFLNNDQIQQTPRLMDEFRLNVNMATTLLRGVVLYLVLKGVSLGLNMIVETDINYREQERGEE
jgi:hypothetical protein